MFCLIVKVNDMLYRTSKVFVYKEDKDLKMRGDPVGIVSKIVRCHVIRDKKGILTPEGNTLYLTTKNKRCWLKSLFLYHLRVIFEVLTFLDPFFCKGTIVVFLHVCLKVLWCFELHPFFLWLLFARFLHSVLITFYLSLCVCRFWVFSVELFYVVIMVVALL